MPTARLFDLVAAAHIKRGTPLAGLDWWLYVGLADMTIGASRRGNGVRFPRGTSLTSLEWKWVVHR
jgi:hypothetical protein